MTFALAAAGTGGHVFPALAVGEALIERGVDREDILFFGGDRMEKTTVPSAGFRFVELEIRGFTRSLSLANFKVFGLVAKARAKAISTIRQNDIKAITTFGGYVAGPVAMAAKATKIPLLLHEQNAIAGLANRIIVRWASDVFVAFEQAQKKLGGTVVGNPLRAEMAAFDRDTLRVQARERYGLADSATVLGVLGGSLGARILNEATYQMAMAHESEKFAIVHLCGTEHVDAVNERASRSNLQWVVLDFEEQMQFFYAACDVVLSRAGALTVSELAVSRTPAVVVPLAIGAGGHQAANAESLAAAGAIVVLTEDLVDQVPAALEQILVDGRRRAEMARSYVGYAHPNAAFVIADAMIEAAT